MYGCMYLEPSTFYMVVVGKGFVKKLENLVLCTFFLIF